MDQQKIGAFLKELRKEKNITQEELAEKMLVSRRTVSRWETGSNMPDLDILIDISEFYDVDLREILDGERKKDQMDKEMKETVLKVADFSNEEKGKVMRNMHILFITAFVLMTVLLITFFADIFAGPIMDFIQGIALGVGYGMIALGVIITSRYARQIREFKLRLLHKTKELED